MIYQNAEGLVFVLVFFLIALIVNYGILTTFKLNKRYLTSFVSLSVFLHFTASTLACLFLTKVATGDGLAYFHNAYNFPNFSLHEITSTYLVLHIVYWLRYFIFGNSLLGTFSFFAFLGSIGATIYLVIFHKLLRYAEYKNNFNFSSKKVKFFSLIILLWPSILYWSSNLGKDGLCYFFLSLCFLLLLELEHNRRNIVYYLSLLLSALPAILIRPYILLVAFLGKLLSLFFKRKKTKNLLWNLFLFALLIILLFPMLHFIDNVFFGGQSLDSFNSITNTSVAMQQSQAVGTHIPLPTNDPSKIIFFLPYTALANLLLPMFVFANNAIGLVASFENFFLLILIILFIKRFKYWKALSKETQFFSTSFWFFCAGLILLGLLNTNLGAAMREKIMYLPLFLINIFVVLSLNYKKSEKFL